MSEPTISLRERAVRNVDSRHGFTVEQSSSPEAHQQEYDEEEERLVRFTEEGT